MSASWVAKCLLAARVGAWWWLHSRIVCIRHLDTPEIAKLNICWLKSGQRWLRMAFSLSQSLQVHHLEQIPLPSKFPNFVQNILQVVAYKINRLIGVDTIWRVCGLVLFERFFLSLCFQGVVNFALGT